MVPGLILTIDQIYLHSYLACECFYGLLSGVLMLTHNLNGIRYCISSLPSDEGTLWDGHWTYYFTQTRRAQWSRFFIATEKGTPTA
jgi:hypothetical protein